jgi:selenocysteine-specific elongation factor
VRLHIGAAEVLARVRILEQSGSIDRAEAGLAQFRFESPIVGVLGDRFVIRSYSPQRTIGGGAILDAFATKHRPRDLAAVRERLQTLSGGNRSERVAAFVAGSEKNGLSVSDLIARTGWANAAAEAAIGEARHDALVADVGGHLFKPSVLTEFKRVIETDVAAHHEAEPLSRGLALEVVRGRHFAHLSPDLFRALLKEFEKDHVIVIEKDIVRAAQHQRAVSGADAALRDKFEALYREANLAPPNLAEALTRAGMTGAQQQHGRKVLQLLIDAGTLVRVDGDLLFHRAALDELIAKLHAHAKQAQSIDVPAFKELAGISRKYAIPLLEYLDRQRVTRREGDRRIVL